MSQITLDPISGYFQRNGERFIPVGVNYWPGSSGVEMWKRWAQLEINYDLDLMVSLGFNTVRFFVRWQDFEPEPGRYDEGMFAILVQFLLWCQAKKIYAIPSVFVGWMSGATFRPDWFQGRNMFSDPFLVERGEAFCTRLSRFFNMFKEAILAVDLGNELCCLRESSEASPAAVHSWCERMAAALRTKYPEAILISGCEQNQVMNDTGWRFGDQPGMNLYSMHGYPVPNWHALRFDGMKDPLAAELLASYTAMARSYGPTMLQEFGTIVTFGKEQQETYLERLLPACWEAGANGFLWWCFRDIKAKVRPYLTNGFEGTLGLVDAKGKVKPGLQPFLDFARGLPERAAPDLSSFDTAVFVSSQYYDRDNQDCPGHHPALEARGILLARHFLQALGKKVGFVHGNQTVPATVKTIVVAGTHLRVDEAEVLAKWVQAGGKLVWHGPDAVNWGAAYIELCGAKPLDYRDDCEVEVTLGGRVWKLDTFPRRLRLEIQPESAEVLASDEKGLPVVLRNRLGEGEVIYSLAMVEETIARETGNPEQRERWVEFYRFMLG
jgi:hypothetical protein